LLKTETFEKSMGKRKGEREMKRSVALSCAFVLLFGLAGVASATTVTFSTTLNLAGDQFVSPEPGAITETFDPTFVQPWTWTGNYGLYTGSVSSQYAAPAYGTVTPYTQETSQYMVVPQVGSPTPQSATVKFANTQNYFGIWWGSIDTYNYIDFYLSGTKVFSYSGSDIFAAANGSWTDAVTNRYVNFKDLVFDEVKLTSNGVAFEFDNVAATPVPIPGAVWLLGSGLLGLIGLRRKFLG
jgi:hypothetical protein